MSPQIYFSEKIQLDPDRKGAFSGILKKMFPAYQRVVVESEFLGDTFSGSWVFLVHLVGHDKGRNLPVVVKIASVSLIDKEWQAYDQHIRGKWPKTAEVREKPVVAPDGTLSGLYYYLVGGGIFPVETLRCYCLDEATTTEAVRAVLQRFAKVIVEGVLLFTDRSLQFRLRASYDRVLPINLLVKPVSPLPDVEPVVVGPQALPATPLKLGSYVRLEDLTVTKVDLKRYTVTLSLSRSTTRLPDDAYHVRLKFESAQAMPAYAMGQTVPLIEGQVIQTRHSQWRDEMKKVMAGQELMGDETVFLPDGTGLPNPFLAWPDILGQFRNIRVCYIHGDLNVGNILVDPDVQDVCLIDFAEARWDHVLHDFLRLETEVMTKLVPPALAEAGLPVETVCRFYEQLHCATFYSGHGVIARSPHPALDKAFAILTVIRQVARDHGLFNRNEHAEYYHCLTLYLLGALKFRNLDESPQAPLPKQVAFWGAAMVQKLLQAPPLCQEDLTGRRIKRYEIGRLIGQGSTATVYRARRPRQEQLMAVKVVSFPLASNSLFRQRFEREAGAVVHLRHPNILTVYDYGETDDGRLYQVVDYVRRGTLRERLQEETTSPSLEGGLMPLREAVKVVAQVAKALDYAHRQGVIHCDVRPNNILLTQSGRPLLADFGLARPIRVDRRLDGSGVIWGTPGYMAPEQAQGLEVDGRADVYALGMTLFELLTGQRPSMQDPAGGRCSVAEVNPAVPPALDEVVTRATARSPDERYQRARDMARALEGYLLDSEREARLSPATADRRDVGRVAELRGTAPAPPPQFTGRRQHLDALKAALVAGDATALLALQGMGGVGKTAIALRLADELRLQFPGGTCWGSLSDYAGHPRPILRNWARMCEQELDETDPNAMADLVRSFLAARQDAGPLLAIVDDVRPEWLDAAQVLKKAIPAGVPLLLTTRDEMLAAALGAKIHRLDVLSAGESLALLEAHVGAAVIEADRGEAEALCQAVGGLPLAIELAGRRLALWARKPGYRLETLRRAVEERAAQILTLPGHPGLAATFAITYEALTLEAQRLFRWLGIFAPGPLGVGAVAGVTGLDETEAEFGLDEFVPLALLGWGEMEGTYTIHPLLRQYAHALLVEAGEADEADERYVAHYLAFAQAHARVDPDDWDRLEEELPNLLLAARRAAEIKDGAALVSFEEALLHESRFLYVRGYYQETVDLLSRSLDLQTELGERQNQPRTLNKLAFFCTRLGRHQEAQEHANAARSLAIALKDREQQADSLNYLGILFYAQGKNELVLAHFEKELEIRHELGKPLRLANCLNALGGVQTALGDYAEAKQYFNKAFIVYDQEGDQEGIARCIGNRGIPSFYMGDYVSALNDFEVALNQNKEFGDRYSMAQNLLNIGVVQSCLGDFALSLHSLQEALTLWQEIGDKANEAVTLSTLAEVYGALGDYQQAIECLRLVDKQLHEISDVEAELEYLNTLGAVYYEQDDYKRALETYLQMQKLVEGTTLKYFLVQNKLGLSRTCLAWDKREHPENARRYAAEAINLCQKMQLAGDEPRGHVYLGKANLLLDDRETALQHCREAMRLLEKQKHVRGSEAELYLMATQVLAANGLEDERRQYLERAYDLVQATAAKIKDKALRQSYLAVPVNREIAAAWVRERGGKAA